MSRLETRHASRREMKRLGVWDEYQRVKAGPFKGTLRWSDVPWQIQWLIYVTMVGMVALLCVVGRLALHKLVAALGGA